MRRPPPERLVLLGHPVAHSRSPQMHNAALAAAGIRARYEALDVAPEQFDSTVRELVREGAAGNVTIPHKERMYAACATLSPIARRVGAVNTWWVDDDGALSGDNTDVGGVHEAVRRLFGVDDDSAELEGRVARRGRRGRCRRRRGRVLAVGYGARLQPHR